MINVGNFRNKITIQSTAQAADAYGALVDTWGTFATWWASVEPLNGREYVEAGKVNAEVTTRIKGRYISGVLPAMRAMFGTRVFSIVSVININERNRELELMCREIS